jgi:hypothetical protein
MREHSRNCQHCNQVRHTPVRRGPAVVGVMAALTLGVAAGGCTAWKTESGRPGEVVAEKKPDRVRVNRYDGNTVELAQPLIAGDSLSGYGRNSPDSARVSMALSDVQSVSIQRVDAGKTAVLIAGLGVTAIAVIAAATDEPDAPTPAPGSATPVSCPLVYSWDGSSWRLDSGTFGGAITPALARTDVDNLMYALPSDGMLRLKVANELNETDYLDAISVLAVDHAPGTQVAPDGDGRIHSLGQLTVPLSAHDFRGREALPRIASADGWSWESNPSNRDTSVIADIRDGLVLTFAHPGTRRARLVVDGHNTPWASHLIQMFVAAHGRGTQAWYDSLETQQELARGLGAMLAREAFLNVSVWSDGGWETQGFIWEAGPEIVKRQVFSLDLSHVAGDSLRIRLESAPSFWLVDYVALDPSAPGATQVREIIAQRAVDHVGTDVAARVQASDRAYYVMEHGASAELSFAVPPRVPGRARSYLVRSTGWYRVHTPETRPPDTRLLSQVLTETHGASRIAVARFNEAISNLERSQP